MTPIFPSFFLTADAVQIHADKLMGRQSAGNGFLRAATRAYAEAESPFQLVHRGGDQAEALEVEVRGAGWLGDIGHALDVQPEQWVKPGVLYYPAPFNSKMAWQRARYGGDRLAFCGVTHTISSHGILSQFAEYVHGAFHPWDALICTSRSAYKTVHQVWDEQCAQLAGRLKVPKVSPDLPMTPVVPLGVHATDFTPSERKRAEARLALGLDESEMVLLFVGRLSFHAKANPWPMYKAAAQACHQSGKKLRIVEFGRFANEAIENSFKQAAQLAGVEVLRIDGRTPGAGALVYAAADIFMSLSDNIQETFGLTPVEAMAAGLPVVVSDWDGYRETVRDGVDGFLIPTAQPADEACLGGVSAAYEDGLLNYDLYIAHAHCVVSVDIVACTQALVRLIEDPSLRKRMGEAGRKRVLESLDWAVVMRAYQDIWSEQNTLREHAAINSPVSARRQPGFLNPLRLFDHYPSRLLTSETVVRVADGVTVQDVMSVRRLQMWGFAKGWLESEQDLIGAWRRLEECGVQGLSLAQWGSLQGWSVSQSLSQAAWMLKVGVFVLTDTHKL